MVANEQEQQSKPHAPNVNILGGERIGCCDWDLDTNAMAWSPDLYRIFGLDQPYDGEVSFLRFMDWFHCDDRERALSLIWLALDSRQIHMGQYHIVPPTGAVRTVGLIAEPRLDAEDQPNRIIVTLVAMPNE